MVIFGFLNIYSILCFKNVDLSTISTFPIVGVVRLRLHLNCRVTSDTPQHRGLG